jgi:hypothetical protein
LRQLTEQGRQRIDELAQRYSVSADAVMSLLQALVNSNGTMAQFNHWELGGNGQWMLGGMTMVGDMFNHGLKAKVDGLCSELSQLLAQQPFVPVTPSFQSQSQAGGQQAGGASISLFVPDAPSRASGQWWPAELGLPNGSGGQNQMRYAYFNATHRLAVELNGHVTVYDSLDHQIGGVSQQQGSGGLGHLHQPIRYHKRLDIARRVGGRRAPRRTGARTATGAFTRCNGPGNRHLQQDRTPGRLAEERHSLVGGVRRQEGRASIPIVKCRCCAAPSETANHEAIVVLAPQITVVSRRSTDFAGPVSGVSKGWL